MKKFKLEKNTETMLITELQRYFETNLEPLTHLQAYLLLDFLIPLLGPEIYNLALEDAHHYVRDQLDDVFVLQKTATDFQK